MKKSFVAQKRYKKKNSEVEMGGTQSIQDGLDSQVVILEKKSFASIDDCILSRVIIENEGERDEKEKVTKLKWSEIKQSKPGDSYYVQCKDDRFYLEVEYVRKLAVVAMRLWPQRDGKIGYKKDSRKKSSRRKRKDSRRRSSRKRRRSRSRSRSRRRR